VADLLEIGELVVTPYEDNLQVVDDLLTARMRHGDSLLGAVINQTPQDRLEYISDHIKPFLEERGIPIFACLPKERFLLSASIADLADGLGGEILSSHHAVDRLVEHLMVGAMDVDQAFNHFHQTTNKAVITGGDRTDIQLSALETSTRCLILTGNLTPRPMIVERAEAMDVPIILTPHDTLTAVEIVEHFFGRSRFHQEEKVQYFDNMLGKYRALNLQLPGGSR
jgi:BioD-like phosphotransacetylase family protein